MLESIIEIVSFVIAGGLLLALVVSLYLSFKVGDSKAKKLQDLMDMSDKVTNLRDNGYITTEEWIEFEDRANKVIDLHIQRFMNEPSVLSNKDRNKKIIKSHERLKSFYDNRFGHIDDRHTEKEE